MNIWLLTTWALMPIMIFVVSIMLFRIVDTIANLMNGTKAGVPESFARSSGNDRYEIARMVSNLDRRLCERLDRFDSWVAGHFLHVRQYFGDMTPHEYLLSQFKEDEVKRLNDGSYRFNRDGVTWNMYAKDVGFIPIVHFWAPWPDDSFRMRLYPETIPEEKKKFMGLQDIQVGSSAFDPLFIIQSNDEFELKTTLTKEVQDALIGLACLDMNLWIAQGSLNMEFRNGFETQREARQACRTMSTFQFAYEKMLASHHGMSIFDIEYTFRSEAICMACGDLANNDLEIAYCRNCNTPHHRECWDFMGSCSTFACGEKKICHYL